MKYIAPFYSHFGAIRFKKECAAYGYEAKLMPVPRDLSSSCGTCVCFDVPRSEAGFRYDTLISEEMEQIVCCQPDGYQQLFQAADC